MDKELATVCTVKKVFEGDKLSIPDYQRPYKWSEKHVHRLIDDLLEHLAKGVTQYRVGTVVLHQQGDQEKPLEIVDGQQRLVSFSLLIRFLSGGVSTTFLKGVFENSLSKSNISRTNLYNNHQLIQQRLSGYSDSQKEALKSFVLEKCEFVVVTLHDISEAFQFFDSQNSRGKSLEPYDLLKAYHLREMSDETEDVQSRCVKQWEAMVEGDDITLQKLFNEYLYRLRKWLRGEPAYYFTKEDIELFKGVTWGTGKVFPYLVSQRISDVAATKGEIDPLSALNAYPFQVDQVMINGKRFFEYVEYYRGLLAALSSTGNSYGGVGEEVFKALNADDYKGRYRTGDQYTRNLFEAVLLYFVDKFGKEALTDELVKLFFRWSYRMRLEQVAVRLTTLENKATEQGNLFRVIQFAVRPEEVLRFRVQNPTKEKVKAKNIMGLRPLFGLKEEGGAHNV
ncbi:MAG: DUF262 domain-containing protein [Zetaproteobacteria bacterium]|nr:DUF262 domain-containing protein [Zetaproteobacteria bacterium]